MLASYHGHLDIIQLLVDLDVDLLARDKDNLTAYDSARNDRVRNILLPAMVCFLFFDYFIYLFVYLLFVIISYLLLLLIE